MDFVIQCKNESKLIITPRPIYAATSYRASARGYSSGCQDDFAIFAFLAFLLTVLDLILELQGGMMKRKKREFELKSDSTTRNSALAAYSLFRGFLNAIDSDEFDCATLLLCEAGLEASKFGDVGRLLTSLSL